jgi:RsiW-degrading membrane proteinase PrsW (M82 family)
MQYILHLLWSIFHIMLTVKHFIQAAISVPPAMMFLPYTVHSNAINLSCNIIVHMLLITFLILSTVTHFIQAEIPVSTCCEISSIERTLYLHSYHVQHSTLALSTINPTTANSCKAVTHSKLILHKTYNACLPVTACSPLNLVLVIFYLRC